MPLAKRFALIFVAFFMAVVIGIQFLYIMAKTTEKDKTAGRQRMLVQKYAKEYLRALAGITSISDPS
jgi:hypothetical protein